MFDVEGASIACRSVGVCLEVYIGMRVAKGHARARGLHRLAIQLVVGEFESNVNKKRAEAGEAVGPGGP